METERLIRRLTGVFFTGFALVHGPWALGAATIDQSNLAPTTSIAPAVEGGTIFGQVVRAGQSGYLTQVDLSLAKSAGLTGDLFFQVLGVDGAGQPDMLDIKAHRVTNLDGVPDATGLSTPLPFPASFDLTPDLIWVEPGDEFVVAVSRFAPGAPPWVTLRTTSGPDGGYAPGTLFSRDFGVTSPWTQVFSGNVDAGFQTWVDPAPALPEANTVEVRPVFDAVGAREPDSDFWTVTDGENGIGVQSFHPAIGEERSVLEFELPRLPDGAVVTGARLNLDMGGGSGTPSIAAHPYDGNGSLEVADVLQLTSPSFSSGPSSPVGEREIELSAEAITSAYADGLDYLGLMLRVDSGFNAGIVSLERNLFGIDDGADVPALKIDFTLAAGIEGDGNGNGQVEQGDLDLVLQNWGDTGSSPGDLNGSGQVEQGDLDVVLQNWGNTVAPDFSEGSVPEPIGLAGLSAVVAFGTRRRSP